MSKTSISSKQNIWTNNQQVNSSQLETEQLYVDNKINSIVNNHIGSGFIYDNTIDTILFDSRKQIGFLDGTPIYPQGAVSDINFGNQLEVSLFESKVNITQKVKVAIIGTDLNGDLQYETFFFSKNESQVTSKHFTKVLVLLFNDISGVSGQSLNLGGFVLVKQAKPGFVSRDSIVSSSNLQPSLFWRDFYLSGYPTLAALLQVALPTYNVSSLNISTTSLGSKILESNNITSFIGQKFKSKTNNIQKITALVSVRNLIPGSETDLAWTGDLVASILPLQTKVSSPYEIAPDLDIEFAPTNNPIAQISFNYNSLLERGIQLSGVPQPVDFVFSNSAVAVSTIKDNYYAFVLRRSGTADKCDLLFEITSNSDDNLRFTTFNNDTWVDISTENLWFELFSDSVKVSDGQYYDAGVGVSIPKYKTVSNTNYDFSLNNLSFLGNSVYYSYFSTNLEKSNIVQDQRTGQPIFSQKENIPSVSLLSELSNINYSSDPLVTATIADKNRKTLDSSPIISFSSNSFGMIGNSYFIKVNDDPSSPKYNTSSVNLKAQILNGKVVGSKILPRTANTSNSYKVSNAIIHQLRYGDLNKDQYVTSVDLIEANKFLGLNLSKAPPAVTSISAGPIYTYENSYSSYINPFVNDSGVSFKILSPTGTAISSDTDGYVVADPINPSLCYFSSTNVSLSGLGAIDGYTVLLEKSTTIENYGGFIIEAIDVATDTLTLRKYYLNKDKYLQFLQCDVNDSMSVTGTDINAISNYINKSNVLGKIGDSFEVIELVLTSFVDRNDDYYSGLRSSLHQTTDLFASDVSFSGFDFTTTTLSSSLTTILNWREEYISILNKEKYIPVALSSNITQTQTHNTQIVYPIPTDLSVTKSSKFIDGDLFLTGDVKTLNGLHKLDFESTTIILQIPNQIDGYERYLNIFECFVSEDVDGKTSKGYKALRFSDGTFVQADALEKNQVRFSISAQAFSPNLETTVIDGYSALLIDNRIGVYIDNNGILTINFNNLFEDEIMKTLSTKVNVQVLLKKSGFINDTSVVSTSEMLNLLTIS